MANLASLREFVKRAWLLQYDLQFDSLGGDDEPWVKLNGQFSQARTQPP